PQPPPILGTSPHPVNARRLVIFAAVIAVGVAAYGSRDRIGLAQRNGSALRIQFAYSPNQEDLVAPLIRRFNTERHRVAGRVVRIDGEAISSGDAETQIAKRAYRPALWSPASSLWGRLLDYQVDARWVLDDNPSLVRTPLVIAMWRPEAEALGWPRPVG